MTSAPIFGPTYHEMLYPETLPASLRKQAEAARANELAAANLFNITWKAPDNTVRHILLPRELTGVEANIIVLVGHQFPSGSHKVGPAYATLLEGELADEIRRDESTIIGPSTGNFGIGVAYIARLKGYPAVVIMPEQMSAERYQRIRNYGGRLDLTPGSESDVILVLERAEEYKKDPRNKVLAQFELLPNYRFHRYVTGGSVLQVARAYGNGRVAAFVAAPGSAGTLATGDEIKTRFPDAAICALEPRECSTLFNNGRGTHRIEGIGDKMVTLIHNVLTTDYVMLIHDDDCVIGLELLQRQQALVERVLHLRPGALHFLHDVFGISGICNILGAMRASRHLGLRRKDNVVTIATDGFDRYPSVLQDLERRTGALTEAMLGDRFEQIFRGGTSTEILDVRSRGEKHRLFSYKEATWTRFGYSASYLESMKSQSFWNCEYEKIRQVDAALSRARGHPSARPSV
ncbi:MAG TPA: pyridoxal-phosphate dependent enzyme [Terriglobales bacterium]|nr:pyridoxal-phosphate dependent enzyme [Terriglobales bacterium]